ncbi:MAG TPA: PspC domain-containing protein [Aggregatilineaceae bacterium]|nr:PspC domain-containing protein [Aggregatilineaceae bacterium]
MNNQDRLFRSNQNHLLAGVCGGIAEYLDVDPTLVRLAFVVLTLLSGGAGVMIYGILWLIVPDQPSEKRKRKRKNMEV